MSSEPTVEECLRELREMFGDTLCELRIRTRPIGLGDHIIDLPQNGEFAPIYAESLSEAMDQVRQWHRENKQ
jgi:hypothetical protein